MQEPRGLVAVLSISVLDYVSVFRCHSARAQPSTFRGGVSKSGAGFLLLSMTLLVRARFHDDV